MSVVDAFALIAYLTDEPSAPKVGRALLGPNPCMSAVNWAEVTDKLVRVAKLPQSTIEKSMDILRDGGFRIVPADEQSATLAGQLRSRHYRRQNSPVSLADCFAVATAMQHRLPLVTSDAAMTAMAKSGDVVVISV